MLARDLFFQTEPFFRDKQRPGEAAELSCSSRSESRWSICMRNADDINHRFSVRDRYAETCRLRGSVVSADKWGTKRKTNLELFHVTAPRVNLLIKI